MPQMSPMSWTMLTMVYLSILMFMYAKFSMNPKLQSKESAKKIKVMKMKW